MQVTQPTTSAEGVTAAPGRTATPAGTGTQGEFDSVFQELATAPDGGGTARTPAAGSATAESVPDTGTASDSATGGETDKETEAAAHDTTGLPALPVLADAPAPGSAVTARSDALPDITAPATPTVITAASQEIPATGRGSDGGGSLPRPAGKAQPGSVAAPTAIESAASLPVQGQTILGTADAGVDTALPVRGRTAPHAAGVATDTALPAQGRSPPRAAGVAHIAVVPAPDPQMPLAGGAKVTPTVSNQAFLSVTPGQTGLPTRSPANADASARPAPMTTHGRPDLPALRVSAGRAQAQPPQNANQLPLLPGDDVLPPPPGATTLAPGAVTDAPGPPPPSGAADQSAPMREAALRIAQAVQQPRHHGNTVEVRLDPPELGHVRLTLGGLDGAVQISISADQPETLELMRRHADLLMREFRDMGFNGAAIDFGAGHRDPDAPVQTAAHDAEAPPPDAEVSSANPAPSHSSPGARLDIRF